MQPQKPLSQKAFEYAFPAAAATAITTPLRAGLNLAPLETNPIPLIMKVLKNPLNGFTVNVPRGGFNVGLQAAANDYIINRFGKRPAGKVAGWLSATGLGTLVGCGLETRLIILQQLKQLKNTYPNGNFGMIPKTRYTALLAALYGIREGGFTGAVLCSNGFSPVAYNVILATATLATAPVHKLIVFEAAVDVLKERYESVPDFKKDGIKETFDKLARGKYSPPALQNILYKNPASQAQLAMNLMWLLCHPTMLATRAIFFVAFKKALNYFRAHTPSLAENKSTWFQPANDDKSQFMSGFQAAKPAEEKKTRTFTYPR